MKLFIVLAIVSIGSAVQGQVPVGRSRTYPLHTPRTEDGVPILSQPYKSQNPTHDEQGLSLYDDFVNDPYKPTEDLGSLLSQRQRELRSGPVDSRDNIWAHNSHQRHGHGARRQEQQHQQYVYRPTAAPVHQQARPFIPIYGDQGNGYWAVSSRGDNHITYVRRDQYAPNPAAATPVQPTTGTEAGARGVNEWRSGAAGSRSGALTTRAGQNKWETNGPPHGENGDEDWIVESRTDGHITYRKRLRHGAGARPAGVHGWRSPQGNTGVRTLGHGDGKVLARVVNTNTEDAFASVHSGYNVGRHAATTGSGHTTGGSRSGLASYKSMRSSYAHSGDEDDEAHKASLQLKSGDFVSYRRQDGNEAVFNRYRDSTQRYQPQVQPTAAPAHYQQEGDWRVVSKGDSHITWSRVGSDYQASPTRRPITHGQGQYIREERTRYGSGPHYPMMRERAFAEKDSRVGTSNVLAV